MYVDYVWRNLGDQVPLVTLTVCTVKWTNPPKGKWITHTHKAKYLPYVVLNK